MRYLILLMLLSSCSLSQYPEWVGIDSVKTIDQAFMYVEDNIIYTLDNGENWQFPEETADLKTGDCEDISALIAHLLIYNVGIDNVLLVLCKRKTDGNGHMMIKIGNKYYESIGGRGYYPNYDQAFKTVKEYSYDDYINKAMRHH